jgi:hypothetical protein
VRIGPVSLGSLREAGARPLDEAELEALRREVGLA